MMRAMTTADLPRAAELSARAGWNQVAADWRVFLRDGDLRVVDDGDPDCLAASAAVLPYGRDLAWISMVLVREDRRRQGLATALTRWAVERLAGTRCVALDATAAGREVYARLGFREAFGFARWSVPELPPARGVRPLRAEDWPAVAALDGMGREALLRNFAGRMPGAAFLSADGRGFALARDGLRAAGIGPVVAPDATSALALIGAARTAIGGAAVLDLADAAGAVAEALERAGGMRLRSFVRMTLGDGAWAIPERNVVLAGPEFG